MSLRITPQALRIQQQSYLRTQTDQLAVYQQQASTGKRLLRPSDGPLDTVSLIRAQADGSRIEAAKSNSKMTQSRLEAANASLLDVSQGITQARDIALQGAETSTNTDTRKILASQVERLLERVVAEANSTVDGRYVFGGTATGSAPFNVTTTAGRITAVTYQGSQQNATATVGSRQFNTALAGDQVFTKPGENVFTELIGLRDELLDQSGQGPAAVQQRVGSLGRTQLGVLNSVGGVSASLEALQNLDSRLADLGAEAEIRAGDLEGADLAEAVINLTTQQTLFGATLAVTARISEQSLLDFIR